MVLIVVVGEVSVLVVVVVVVATAVAAPPHSCNIQGQQYIVGLEGVILLNENNKKEIIQPLKIYLGVNFFSLRLVLEGMKDVDLSVVSENGLHAFTWRTFRIAFNYRDVFQGESLFDTWF